MKSSNHNIQYRFNILFFFLPLYGMLLYFNTIGNDFVFDDIHQVVNNPWIRDFRNIDKVFTSQVWEFAGKNSNYYRPMMHVLYTVIYVLVGPQAWMFHLVNILLHGMATLLVYLVASRVLTETPVETSRFPLTGAWVAGLIFAVHPVHAEAVAWIGSVPDLACTVFYLMSVLLFLRANDVGDRWVVTHGVGAACFLASVLFKEPGATIPFMILLLDLIIRPANRGMGFWMSRYGFLVVAGCVYLVLRIHALGGFAPAVDGSTPASSNMVEVIGSALWWYLAVVVAPVNLNIFHTMESATGLPPAAIIVLPILLIVAVRRRSFEWTTALGMFLLPLVPALYALALLPGLDNPWAERYIYLPSAGIAIGAGYGFNRIAEGGKYFLRTISVVLVAVLVWASAATIQRNTVWKNDLTLWADAVEKSPNAWAAQSYYGYALFKNGDTEGAIRRYRKAIRMKPEFADAHQNLAVALATDGRHEAAVAEYAEAIRLAPRNALACANLSISLSALGKPAIALEEAEKAISIDSNCSEAHTARGVALGNMGDIKGAADSFRRAIALDPNDASSVANLEKARQLMN